MRQTKTNLDNVEESSTEYLWNMDGNTILSENLSGSASWCLNDGPKTQVTSRPETISPEVRSSM